jgi:hypothetical protein
MPAPPHLVQLDPRLPEQRISRALQLADHWPDISRQSRQSCPAASPGRRYPMLSERLPRYDRDREIEIPGFILA